MTKTEILLCFVVAAVALILFAESLSFGFVCDDFVLVQRVRSEGFFFSWGGPERDIYLRPVTVLTYYLDNLLWGTDPMGYHLTNTLWHLFCVLLVYLLGLEVFQRKNMGLAAAGVFLLLACHSEAVTWISGRTDLVSGALAIGSVVLFLRGRFTALPLYLTALFAKEAALAVPFVWMIFLIRERYRDRRRMTIALSGAGLMAGYLVYRYFTADLFGNMGSAGSTLSPLSVPLNLFRYVFRVFVPPLPGSARSFLESNPIVLPLVSGSVFFCLFALWKKGKTGKGELSILLCSFAVTLLPVLFMGVSLFDSRSERFLYLPGVFAVLALVELVFTLLPGKRALSVLLVFALLQGGFLYRSNRNWKRAGELCVEIVESGSTERPDNYRGAYVFRNGFDEACILLENE